MSTRTVHDPFLGKDVQVSNRLTDRLRGKYARGPTMPNGEPEFGWATHEVPPIQIEAAAHIEALEAALKEAGEMWIRKDNRIEALTMRAGATTCVVNAMDAALRDCVVELSLCAKQLSARPDGSVSLALNKARAVIQSPLPKADT